MAENPFIYGKFKADDLQTLGDQSVIRHMYEINS